MSIVLSLAIIAAVLKGAGAIDNDSHSDYLHVSRLKLPALQNETVRVPIHIPISPPFNVTRRLMIPRGFAIDLVARIVSARFMLVLPNLDILVSSIRWAEFPGNLTLLRFLGGHRWSDPSEFIKGLRRPHGLAFLRRHGKSYIYVAESHRVVRYQYRLGDRRAGKAEIIVNNLNDSSPYEHPLKNIAIKNDILYLSIASTTNGDPIDLQYDPKRAAIYAYPVDGGKPKLVAEGIRNAEGLAFAPDTGDLWVVGNNFDFPLYPYHDDSGNYGKSIVEYMDDNPPEPFLRIVQGDNYGWPFCLPVANPSMVNLSFVPEIVNNPDGKVVDCNTMHRADKAFTAHDAPLGFMFWTGYRAPVPFTNGAVVALHGSSNTGRIHGISGNKVVFFPWSNGRPGAEYPLVSGWIVSQERRERWGRPVGVTGLPDGSLLISDDYSGSVYRLHKKRIGDLV